MMSADVTGRTTLSGEDGLLFLGPHEVAARGRFEVDLEKLLESFSAIEVELPRLLRINDVSSIDYFRNFPHLGMLATGIADPSAFADRPDSLPAEPAAADLADPEYVLPSAGCYGLYFALRDTVINEFTLFTLRGHCYRREDKFHGLDRLLGFTMREIVAIGAREQISDFVNDAHDAMRYVARALGVNATVMPASDPFFDQNGSRARMQALTPVKYELVSDRGVALASTNLHRNFFGERCRLFLPDGSPAFTACLGFGIERWLSALHHTNSGM